MEETPEQVLARLARYRESLMQPRGSAPGSAARLSPGASARASVATTRSSIAAAEIRIRNNPVPALTDPGRAVWNPAPPATEFIPEPLRVWPAKTGRGGPLAASPVGVTVLGQLLGVVACVLTVLAYVHFGRLTASVIVGVLAVAGWIAAARRVPFALWWSLGLALGAAIGCFS